MEQKLKILIKTGSKSNLANAGVTKGELKYTTDSKEMFIGDGTSNVRLSATIIETTYAALKALRNAGELMPGQQYRITDYVTTTVQEDTQSAEHPFDIIVTADDVDKLNENARACLHESDTYFASSKLEAWQLKYCLDNDTSRFAWADTVNGKGVIYRMIDEWNNDCPYDFKNIQFKRKLTDGELDLDSGTDTWVYTFTMIDLIADKVVDISLKQNTEYMNDEGNYGQCYSNVIKEALESGPDSIIRVKLNDNVLLNGHDGMNDFIYYGCSFNTFGVDCYNNTFGDSCSDNTFGDNCSDNTFSGGCHNNTLGAGCGYNTFGNNCYENTFGGGCYNNTFGNSFGTNTFGDECGYNTFGNTCIANTFGFGCTQNIFGNDFRYSVFGTICQYLKVSDNSSTQKNYIHVDNGTQGASSFNQFDLYDPAILNKNYQVTFKKSAGGKYLMLWATDTGTMTGKVKDSNIDTTWEDIV